MNGKKAGYAAVAVLIAAALSGCGGANSNANDDATEKENEKPTLSVYNTPSPERIEFSLKPGNLELGTKVRISAYNGGFDNDAPGCNGPETTGTDVVISERNEVNGSLSQPGVGNVRLVITAPGYASSCEGAENTLDVKWNPAISINAKDNAPGADPVKTPAVGEPFTVSIGTDIERRAEFAGGFSEDMTIEAHGPYSNIPELQASACPDDAPIAATLTQPYQFTKAGTAAVEPPALQISDPGTYWFSVKIAGGERSLESSTTTCDGDVSDAVVIVK